MSIFAAQILLFVAAITGLLTISYVHLFMGRSLTRYGLRRDGARNVQDAGASPPTPTPPPAALVYERQEQIGRLLQAKIDIIRGAVETRNRMLLLQAQAACEGTPALPLHDMREEVRGIAGAHLAAIDQQIDSLRPAPTGSRSRNHGA